VSLGDLVVLYNIGGSTSLVLWAEWNEYEKEEDLLKQWPLIVGQLQKNEVALVIEIFVPKKGPKGAKICTKDNLIGWISSKHLVKIDDQTW
jgi:hypothetical protein